MSSRLDVWLVENGFAPSRQKAQALIESGRVVTHAANGRILTLKKSSVVDEVLAAKIRVETDEGPEFVSRGGLKLLGAIKATGVAFENRIVLDIGISTGGFADCALQAGASKIVGVDVGHGQLSKKLADDQRVTLLEGINAREIALDHKIFHQNDHRVHPNDHQEETRAKILAANGGRKFEIVVIDVSFISLKLILPGAAVLLQEGGHILALVKPQFEVGREGIGRGGIVKDPKLYPGVETSLRDVCASLGLKVESYFESSIEGSDGNREFFIHATVPQLGFF